MASIYNLSLNSSLNNNNNNKNKYYQTTTKNVFLRLNFQH